MNYVVLTHDLDFGAILAATQRRKPRVVQLRASDVRPEVIGLQVVAALRQLQVELDNGALITESIRNRSCPPNYALPDRFTSGHRTTKVRLSV